MLHVPRHNLSAGLPVRPHDLFSQHGQVLSCRVARKDGQCPIGFVQFTNSDQASPGNGSRSGLVHLT